MTRASNHPDEVATRIVQTERWLAQDPVNPYLLAQMVDLHLEAGNRDAAAAVAAHALQCHPHDPQLRLMFATAALAGGQFAQAAQVLEPMLDAPARQPAIGYNLAIAYLRQGRYADVVALLAGHPDVAEAVPETSLLQARCLHQLGQVDSALASVQRYLAFDPGHADALGLAALLAFDQGRQAEAGRLAGAALAASAGNRDALVVRAWLALDAGDFAVASAACEAALAADPQCGRAWLCLALIELYGLRFETAIAKFRQAVVFLPSHPGSWAALAWAHLLVNDTENAELSFLKALEQDRNFSECHGGLAMVAIMQGKFAEARRHTARALRLNAASHSGRFAQAMLAGDINDTDSARAFVLGAVKHAKPL